MLQQAASAGIATFDMGAEAPRTINRSSPLAATASCAASGYGWVQRSLVYRGSPSPSPGACRVSRRPDATPDCQASGIRGPQCAHDRLGHGAVTASIRMRIARNVPLGLQVHQDIRHPDAIEDPSGRSPAL